MKHFASVSFGKDSLAMLLKIIEKGMPLDEVVFYDTGMEFQAIYDTRDAVLPILKKHGITYTELQPKRPFLYDMFEKPKRNGEFGYRWCGGLCRWGTEFKTYALDKYSQGCNKYVGIAADETRRLQKEYGPDKSFPLNEWGLEEHDCLKYCYEQGFTWVECGVRLYDLLDRVSCWCCRNKNLKELKNIYIHLPDYWERLKDLQRRIPEPMKGPGKSVFELEERFKLEISTCNQEHTPIQTGPLWEASGF